MPESKIDRVAEQEALVSEYIEDARSVMDDPEAGEASLVKAADLGIALLHSVSKEAEEAINRTTDHVYRRKAAQRDPRCSAGKVRRLEKAEKALVAQHEALSDLYADLSEFMSRLQQRLHEYESEEAHEDENSERLETSKKVPWWKRLLGVHQEEPLEPRESSVTPSFGKSDEERYEEFLGFYSEVLTHLQRVVAIRQKDPMVYENKPELAERWQKQYDEQLDHLAWADKNMDAIEESNPEIVSSGLIERRENLASRRDEVAPDSFQS